MAKHGHTLALILFVSLSTNVIGATVESSTTSPRKDAKQVEARRAQRARCVSCSVNGQLYDGHSRFQYEEGCNRYRCICRCDGSWECPAKHTENICTDSASGTQEKQSQSSSSSSVSSSSSSFSSSSSSSSSSAHQRSDGRCRSCMVNGKEQPGHSYFTHVEGCLAIDNCICHCNGSWVCPQERARNTCGDGSSRDEVSKTATWTVEIGNNQNGSSGSSFVSSSSSEVSSSSRRSSSSSSSSSSGSGSENSRGSSVLSVSSNNGYDAERNVEQRQSYGGCQNCSVAGQVFAGNSYFELEDGCRKMKRCSCYCNGSWVCPDRFVENTCGEANAAVSTEQASSCRACQIKGKTFPGNQRFQITEGCTEYRNCICNCDGSWNCPETGARNVCDQGSVYNVGASGSSCRRCQVKGQSFPGNQYFQITDGCIEYKNCICNCDGSWNCPSAGAKNICDQGSANNIDSASGSNCRQCQVKGQSFPGNQYFQITDGCIEYKNCICNCDGSWNCPSTGAKNICDQGSANNIDSASGSNCRQCQVKGQSFPGNQYFQITDGCIEYKNCICNCNGSWNCPSSGAKNICDQGSAYNVDSASGSNCRRCQVKGQSFPGNQYFQITDGCVEYKNCICNCDGSWNCPDTGARNICDQGSVYNVDADSGSSCRRCQVKGQSFPGNQYFEITDGCIEYKNCICNCDGSWNCPDSGARNICDQGSVSTPSAASGSKCRQCDVKGQSFPGNQYFQLTDGCLEYTNCICRCDGSWSCPGEGARNICQQRKEETCRNCEVYGSSFPGNQYFQVRQGCVEYRNCICHCNGTWSCPSDSTSDVCSGATGRDLDGTDDSGTSTTDCSTCLAYGKTFKGGDYFDVVDGCTSYSNCVCRCNGSWDCNSRFATNICVNETITAAESRTVQAERTVQKTISTDYRNSNNQQASSSSTDNQCSFCNTKSKTVRGNSYFELIEGCIEYKNCICRCDGSWQCPSQFAKNICIENNQTSSAGLSPTTCSNCVAKGKIIRGNSYFELIDGCTRFTSCRCNCDGTWDCPPDRSQNICFTNTSVSDNGCSLCQSSDGTVHQPNSRFKLTEDCIEYSCDCFCNGSWSCPGKRSRWVCNDRCLQCDVNGRKFQNNTQFVHKTGCLEYTCNCHCNGSWSCPGNSVRNTCPVGVRDGCNKCRVSSNEVYEGESDFVLKQECLHYKCRCNCDGSYSCPGKDARNVCRGEVIGGCRSCVVSEREIHRGETDFTMRKDCINYECRCNCDGSWECPSEKARNICLGEAPGGCRACRVSETESYRANSVFEMRRDCIHYKCKCNCDGSYSCPGEDARDVCKGETPGGCKSCVISDNEFYPGNSNFEMVKNCIHYKCRCNCDGGYSCPGQTARRVCQAGERSSSSSAFTASGSSSSSSGSSSTINTSGSSSTLITSGSSSVERPSCRLCKVSEAEQFQGNTTFSIERGCARYECECRCDGSWQCPAAKTRDICVRDSVRPTSATRCNACKVSKEVYPGNSSFKFTRGCSQFDCRCDCSGRWSCDHKNRVNICRANDKPKAEQTLVYDAGAAARRHDLKATSYDIVAAQTSQNGSSSVETDIRSQESYSSNNQYTSRTSSDRSVSSASQDSNGYNNCKPCNADGRTIQPNTVFALDRGCIQYTKCRCLCDGRWQCAEEINRCGTTQTPLVAQGDRSYRTETESVSSTSSKRHQVDSSGWVFVNGVDSSFKTKDEQTGGGYAVQVDTKYSPMYATRGQGSQRLEQLEERPSSSSTFAASGSSSSSSGSSSTFITSGSSPDTSLSTSHESKGTDKCLRCQVDTKTYPSGANFDMRRGCVVYKCLCLCSGSYRCRLTSDNECSMQDKQQTCSNCLYQGMVFPGNMGFTVRDGCEEKQCNCNCDGTHVCPSSKPIPGCTDANAHAPGYPAYGNFYPVAGGLYPVSNGYITNSGRTVYQSVCTTCLDPGTGPVVYHTPIHPAFGEGGGGFVSTEHRFSVDQGIPRETCPGCFIDGQTRAGNSTFTFQKECIEFDCYCACAGSWKCAGRLAIDCTPGFAPETVPHTTGCRSCVVQGTTYPANARFTLRQGCHEYQCSCNCDGGWSCPRQHPVNLCPSTPDRPVRGNVLDPQIVREEVYLADQGNLNRDGAKLGELVQSSKNEQQTNSKEQHTATNTCRNCEVRGVTYQTHSKFFLREGCIQRICECHCNSSWSCSEKTVDLCKIAALDANSGQNTQCSNCRVGSDVFIAGKDFQINNGCYQHNCYCHCNGTHNCPAHLVRNVCNPDVRSSSLDELKDDAMKSSARIIQSVVTSENGDVIAAGQVAGCKECQVDGEKIEPLATFVKQLGCVESLCRCQCNGKPSCPPSASVNTCELPDTLPMNQRKGCQVGRRTHLTRVFAHIENCIQRTCVCHDNGEWSCKRTADDIKVC